MAKFSVCRIYKVTLWLNFSYNYSVNLLQILHLYIHPAKPHHRKPLRPPPRVLNCFTVVDRHYAGELALVAVCQQRRFSDFPRGADDGVVFRLFGV